MSRPRYEYRAQPFDASAPRGRRSMGIARVSTLKQEEGTSIDDQLQRFREYCVAKGLGLVGIAVIHESGKDASRRPAFNEAMAQVETAGVGNVLFCFADRMGRNMTDHERMEIAVKAGKFVLHLTAEGRIFDQRTPDCDWLVADFSSLTAKHYSRDLSRRAKDSMDRKAEQGIWPTRPPIDYRNVKKVREDGQVQDRDGTIGLVPQEAEAVRLAVKLRLDGWSLLKINDALLESGLLSLKRQSGFRKPGKAARVKAFLTNPFYIGEFVWRGKCYDGKHDPLLSRREWDAVQATFGGGAAPVRELAKKGPYVGMFRCAECGCRITYDPKQRGDRRYEYYRCANGKHFHKSSTNVSEKALTEGLAPAIDSLGIDHGLAKLVAEALNRGHEEVRTSRRREASRYRGGLKKLEDKEDSLIELRTGGSLDDALFG